MSEILAQMSSDSAEKLTVELANRAKRHRRRCLTTANCRKSRASSGTLERLQAAPRGLKSRDFCTLTVNAHIKRDSLGFGGRRCCRVGCLMSALPAHWNGMTVPAQMRCLARHLPWRGARPIGQSLRASLALALTLVFAGAGGMPAATAAPRSRPIRSRAKSRSITMAALPGWCFVSTRRSTPRFARTARSW